MATPNDAVSVTTLTGCRVCGARLQTILDFGPLHVSAFPTPTEPDSLRAPLDLCRCASCGLVQLRDAVDPAYLYQEYWYRSGVNETMVEELRDIVAKAMDWSNGLPEGAVVVDIGANDGTLLEGYGTGYLTRVAYEPAANLQQAVLAHTDICVPQVFPPIAGYLPKDGSVSIVTSIACLYDLADPVAFAKAVARLLAPTGLWIIQLQDLHQMIRSTAFDNACHEHVTYLSLGSIHRIVSAAGLRVTHVERRAINGGSLRVYVQHADQSADRSVGEFIIAEAECESWVTLNRFAHATRERISQIKGLVDHLKARDRLIDLYGASTKANTLLQVCGLGGRQIRQAWERSPEKWGRRTAGSGIPIVSEEIGRVRPPDALLVGIWQFREAILRREAAYAGSGREVIFPLPVVEVVR